VRALLHSVYDQPDATSVHAQFDRILDALADKLPAVAEHLDGARADVLAFTASSGRRSQHAGDALTRRQPGEQEQHRGGQDRAVRQPTPPREVKSATRTVG
jgi:hypothetical protein